MKANLNINYMLRSDFESFIGIHYKEFKHVFMNFDKILFIKSESESKPVEIYKVSEILNNLLPEFKYIIIASDKYNYVGIDKNRLIYHTLKHIPTEFNGEIVPHSIESFRGEEKFKV